MGRLILYSVILGLAAFVLSAAFVLKHGGESSEAVMQVSVHDLSTFTERYLGERVTTQGELHRYEDPSEHFVVEEEDSRVAISGIDRKVLLSLEGQRVTVTGRFDFEEGTGRYIDADSVTPVP